MVQRIIFSICIFVMVLSGCIRKEADFIGPEYTLAPTGFNPGSDFKASIDVINFSSQGQSFETSKFSHKVSWFITLKGLSSGATYTLLGLGDEVTAANSLWKGNHQGLNFFRKEDVSAELSFLGSNIVLTDTFTIYQSKNYADQGIILGSFEGNNSGFSTNSNPVTGFKVQLLKNSVHGDQYMELSGVDVNNEYYVGGIMKSLTSSLYPSPDSLYFNMYVLGTGDLSSRLNITFQEDDLERGPANGQHYGPEDDAFQYQIIINHIGWKLISVKYADFVPSNSLANGGNGNKIQQTKQIKALLFNLISSPAGNSVKAAFDFPIITFGKPFEPNK